MPAMNYKIWQWGPKCRQGTLEAWNVGITTRAKRGGQDSPFAIANELIALRLGKAIGLPIPDGFVIWRDDEPYFASMNFNLDEWNLPPADVVAVATDTVDMACGVLVFDCWIVNNDRHHLQLHYDKTKKALYLFDHHLALYGIEGFSRLMKNVNSLGVRFHCLIQEITNLMYVNQWIERIAAIPKYYIREAVREGAYVGVPPVDISSYVDFLCERRAKLRELIIAHRQQFSKAQSDLFFNADQIAPGNLEFQI
jgi:hypothetical protein